VAVQKKHRGNQGRHIFYVFVRSYLFSTGFRAVFNIRLMQFAFCFFRCGKFASVISSIFKARLLRLYGIDVAPTAEILGGLRVEHPVGIVIGHGVKIGRNCFIGHQVSMGLRNTEIDPETAYPTVGDYVSIGAGAILLGDIRIGDNSVIGAGSIVLSDVEPGQRVVGIHK